MGSLGSWDLATKKNQTSKKFKPLDLAKKELIWLVERNGWRRSTMTALDTNILVGIMVSSSSLHEEALRGLANLSDDLCTTPTNIGECLRLLTHPKVFRSPVKIGGPSWRFWKFLESLQCTHLGTKTPHGGNRSMKVEKLIPGLRGTKYLIGTHCYLSSAARRKANLYSWLRL